MAALSKVLVVGGGIAGLCLASALRDAEIEVDIVELKREWTVYGVGIIQQCNVVRAMAQLGLLERYLQAGFPFEEVRIADGNFVTRAVIPGKRLAGPQYPANMGVSRLALHEVLSRTALEKGTHVRLGLTVTKVVQSPDAVSVTFSDASTSTYDLVVGADGIASKIRALVFGEQHVPRYTGQGVWRYNFRRRPEVDCLTATNGPNLNAGLVPLSDTLMYLYVTSEEPSNQRFPADRLHLLMRERIAAFGGLIGELRDEITDPAGVVYRPIETVFVEAPWHRGRVVLIGDAAHSTTPHLGQGAGMAIEDAVVLSQELVEAPTVSTALERFMTRRYDRCRFVCDSSEEICAAELSRSATLDRVGIVQRMLARTAEPV